MINKPRAEGMSFERIIKMFLGKKAHQIVCIANNPKERNKIFRMAIKTIHKKINSLETTPRHKQIIMNTLINCEDSFNNQNEFDAICDLFALVANLMGITGDGYKGYSCFTPIYVQNEDQYFTEKVIFKEEDEYRVNERNIITQRVELIKQLKNDGFNTYKISQILNQSEYEIKKFSKL